MIAGRTATGASAGGRPAPAARLSKRVAVIAAEARAAFGFYRRTASPASYVDAGARLLDARKAARPEQWGAVLDAAGIEEAKARELLAIARGGWTVKALADVGGVAAALRVQAWRDRLVSGEAVSGPGEALEALRICPDAFVAYCEARDMAPVDAVAGLAIPEGEAEAVSGDVGALARRRPAVRPGNGEIRRPHGEPATEGRRG